MNKHKELIEQLEGVAHRNSLDANDTNTINRAIAVIRETPEIHLTGCTFYGDKALASAIEHMREQKLGPF